MPLPADTCVSVHRRFDDFDALATAARHWDLDFMQLDRGPFEGEMLEAKLGEVLLSEGRFGRTLTQRGSAPKAVRTFVVPGSNDVHFKWRRKEVGPNDLLVFPRSGELHAVSQPDFHVFTISLSESLLEETAEVAGATRLPEMLRDEKLPCPPPSMDRLRKRLRGLTRAARADAGLPAHPAVLRELRCEIPLLIVRAMAGGASADRLPTRKRDRAIRRAEAYVTQFQQQHLTVGDVCQAAQVSERTLQYAFLEQFGVAPRAYLKAVRLNGARRELKRAEAGHASVREIAGHWGFWHMGQFSADYRRQFGELPSQALSPAVE